LIVFYCNIFHTYQCLEKFKADIVHPTPDGADLTGSPDHVAIRVKPTKPTSFVFDSPAIAAIATKAASAMAAQPPSPRGLIFYTMSDLFTLASRCVDSTVCVHSDLHG